MWIIEYEYNVFFFVQKNAFDGSVLPIQAFTCTSPLYPKYHELLIETSK